MRDPKRINQTLYYLNCIWQKQPDMRFNQLIHSLQWEFNRINEYDYSDTLYRKNVHDAAITFEEADVVDLFYVEDDKFNEFLKEKVKQLKPEEDL